MFWLYELVLGILFVLALPVYFVVGVMKGKYLASFRQRLGRYPGAPFENDIWIQAVSVGEVMVAKTLIDEILRLRPQTEIVLTTTTQAGQMMARRLFPQLEIAYFPFDFSFSILSFLYRYRPKIFLSMETEIWPNVVNHCSSRGIRVALANGRVSDRSFPRYKAVRRLIRPILRRYQMMLVREELDRERLIAIGAPAECVSVVGNIKFDFAPDEGKLEIEPAIRAMAGTRPIFVIGSTVAGEDEAIIPLLVPLADECFFVLAPRKPERFEIVAGILHTAGLRHVRRSQIDPSAPVSSSRTDVLLLDSIGELARVYRTGFAAFVGGSLQPTGGHNPIEPAAAGIAVAFGPHMSNFRDIASAFLKSGGATEVASPEELVEFIRTMLSDPGERERRAAHCREVVEANRGAAARTAEQILGLLQ